MPLVPKVPVGGDESRAFSFEGGSGPSDLSSPESPWSSATPHLCAGLSLGSEGAGPAQGPQAYVSGVWSG